MRLLPSTRRLAAAVVAGVVLAGCGSATAQPDPLLSDRFTGRDGLITNERVVYDEDPTTPVSRQWVVTSGSLFRRDGWGWTGVPDARSPDEWSARRTGSAVFRMLSRRRDLADVAVELDLRVDRFVATRRTPRRATDGVHLMLRWRSEHDTYYVSVDRRDGTLAIKRKRPGGPSNGGTYTTLAHRRAPAGDMGAARRIRASARNVRGGVRLTLTIDGRTLLDTVDRGAGGPPLRRAGAIGVRTDNVEARFDDLRVVGLR